MLFGRRFHLAQKSMSADRMLTHLGVQCGYIVCLSIQYRGVGKLTGKREVDVADVLGCSSLFACEA